MINEPINEGPPNRVALLADALAEIDAQYSGIHDVLGAMVDTLGNIDRRLWAVEKQLKRLKR